MNSQAAEAESRNSLDIAVIGMACKFPQADNVSEYWSNLCRGVETVTFFSKEELLERGIPEKRLQKPDYVRAASVFDHHDRFDAGFFGINPNEAKTMDPQHRFFLECSWEAFEDAGYVPGQTSGSVGVFAGTAMNTYITEVLLKNREFLSRVSPEQIMIGNDKDYVPTRVSYKLNLKGPSISVNTACSSSLVAIHLARQSLLLGECDMALAGGVSVLLSTSSGYTYMKEGILSPDGHCRPFDADSKGTIWGDGCGAVLLKRLSDAVADNDNIYAVIKGSAVNNDGSNKVGFTAPGVEAQSQVMMEALAVANLSPDDIHYIETHGTGTQLGDLIEVSAMSQVYRGERRANQSCPIGSVKSNMGHLNTAAGIAGFIKTVLTLKNRVLPPSINFKTSNPNIGFEQTPFYVNQTLTSLKGISYPLRAGVNSMGIGGTNGHLVLEEAPNPPGRPDGPARTGQTHTLLISARSSKALDQACSRLADRLEADPELALKDVAFTLRRGRQVFDFRRAVRCRSIDEAVAALRIQEATGLLDGEDHEPLVKQWLNGMDVCWTRQEEQGARRISLPPYPFERSQFWVEPTCASDEQKPILKADESYYTKKKDIADWFYFPMWKQSQLPLTPRRSGTKRHLVFTDDWGLGKALAQKLRFDGDFVATVSASDAFCQESDTAFTINPSEPEHFTRLIRELRTQRQLPDSILYFWSLDTSEQELEDLNLESHMTGQTPVLFSAFYLTQALAEEAVTHALSFIAFTNGAYEVIGTEKLRMAGSTMAGICMVMQQEYDQLSCRTVDVGLTNPINSQVSKLAGVLYNEIHHNTVELIVAYRQDKRYERIVEQARVEKETPRSRTPHENGVYLVYSGLEGVGFTISEHLVDVIGAKLLILEEEQFPPQEHWERWLAEKGEEHPLSPRIRNAIRLIRSGAEYIGQISSVEETARLISEAEERFGAVQGVIHAPGATGVRWRRSIRESTVENWRRHFKMIMFSLIVLDHVFRERQLDFRLMLNALASVLGGFGTSNIAAVSDYAKCYTAKVNSMGYEPWKVQCWDASVVIWGKVKAHIPDEMYNRLLEPTALTYEEGIECFERTFAAGGAGELAISATDLNNRYNRWLKVDDAESAEQEELHERPDLQTAFVAPRSEKERSLASFYSLLLGIENVGIHDDFFELGGHSLLGLQLISKIREHFGIDIDSYDVYKYPTVAAMTAFLAETTAVQTAVQL